MTIVLQVEDLTWRQRGLRDVSLSVGSGEVVGLLGANGSGKTSLLAAIAGDGRPDAGRVKLDGRELGRSPVHARARAGLGWLPQRTAVIGGLTVRANLALALEAEHRVWGRAETEAARAFGLEAMLARRARGLSEGEKRRLELARLRMRRPRLLLLDEPLAGLDADYRAVLLGWLRAHAANGGSALWCDHDEAAVRAASVRVTRLGAPREQSDAT